MGIFFLSEQRRKEGKHWWVLSAESTPFIGYLVLFLIVLASAIWPFTFVYVLGHAYIVVMPVLIALFVGLTGDLAYESRPLFFVRFRKKRFTIERLPNGTRRVWIER